MSTKNPIDEPYDLCAPWVKCRADAIGCSVYTLGSVRVLARSREEAKTETVELLAMELKVSEQKLRDAQGRVAEAETAVDYARRQLREIKSIA